MTFKCPKCQKALTARDDQGGARVKCPHCGAVLQVPGHAPVQPAAAQAATRQPAAQRVCPGCGAAVPATAVLCVQCGYDFRQGAVVLRPVAASKRAKRPKGNRKLLIGVGVGAGVVVVVLVLAIALWPSGEARPPAGGQPVASGVQPGSPAAPGAPAGSAPAPPTSAGAAGVAGELPQMMWDADLSIPAWAGQQKDEPFDVKQFLESRKPPPDNAAPLYFAAMAEVGVEMYAGPSAPAWWPWRSPAPPQVAQLAQSINNLSSTEKLRAGAFPMAEIERVLLLAQPMVQKVDQAQQKPRCIFVTGTTLDARLPHVQTVREFSRLTQLQLYHARVKGDSEQAENAVRRTLRMSRDLLPRGGLMNQLLAIAVDGIVLAAVRDFTLSQPGMDAQRCDRLLAVLSEHRAVLASLSGEAFRMEYIFLRNTIHDLEQGRRPVEEVLRMLVMDPNTPSFPALVEQLKKANWQSEIATSNRMFAVILATLAKPVQEVLATKPISTEYARIEADKTVMIAQAMPGLQACLLAADRLQTDLAGTQALIAVRRYALAHGTPPADLETACREAGLPAVPTDPFSGQPMRYKLMDGKPVVYSIGFDQKDDGGAVVSLGPPLPGDQVYRIGE